MSFQNIVYSRSSTLRSMQDDGIVGYATFVTELSSVFPQPCKNPLEVRLTS
jgi:hypothetical protein